MQHLWKCLLGIACLSFMIACQDQKKKPADDHNRIDELFKKHHANDRFHGGVVITQYGKTIYENYLGLADRSWNLPVEKEVKFDIASINKSMIAALVLKATEEGKLSLEDKLSELLTEFSYSGNFHPDISIHHLLCHSSGLPDYDAVGVELSKDQFLKFKRTRFSNEEYVDFISQLDPVGEPYQQFYYSNFAYHLLAIILEESYAKSFGEILKDKLTQPLGLKHTLSKSKNEVIIKNLAQAYNFQETTGEWLQNPFIDLSLGRRIFSTAADLNRWAQVMDNPGYLSKKSLELMQQNHWSGMTQNVSYGYGWVVFDEENKSPMGDLGIDKSYIIHGGSTDGYKGMLININKGEYVISFLSNVGDRTQEMELAKNILELLNK